MIRRKDKEKEKKNEGGLKEKIRKTKRQLVSDVTADGG